MQKTIRKNEHDTDKKKGRKGERKPPPKKIKNNHGKNTDGISEGHRSQKHVFDLIVICHIISKLCRNEIEMIHRSGRIDLLIKKDSRKKIGHRQKYTTIRVDEILPRTV